MTDLEDVVNNERRGPDYNEIRQMARWAGILTEQFYASNNRDKFFFEKALQYRPSRIKDEGKYMDSVLDYYLDSKQYYDIIAKRGNIPYEHIEMLTFRDTFEYMLQVSNGWAMRNRKPNDLGR
jgi:hypothetical protein